MQPAKYGLILVLLLIASCEEKVEFDVCRSTDDEGFIAAMAKELSARNIKHEKRHTNEICYSSENSNEVSRAESIVRGYRHSVAGLLTNDQEEKRVISWLQQEKMEYKITDTDDGNRLLIIFSNSPEEAEKNRADLYKVQSDE